MATPDPKSSRRGVWEHHVASGLQWERAAGAADLRDGDDALLQQEAPRVNPRLNQEPGEKFDARWLPALPDEWGPPTRHPYMPF